jgi:HEAT repeat protein
LHAQDPHDAAEAQAELKRRGFGEREIALARQLSDPDPQTRRRLVRQLPGLAGLDAAPWLVELSRDADAEVRWTALTLLATTNDPALLDRVAELVRGDPDPRIQRLAERLSQAPQK